MSGWSPLRFGAFRRWWLANLTSNVGSWMQTVAAQWLMTSLTSSAVLVGAIQATNLPVLLLAIPAGVLGDLLDRKKLILAGQGVMLVAAAALGVLAAADAVTPGAPAAAQTRVPAPPPAPEQSPAGARRTGGRFVRNSPALLAIMVRGAAFGFFATGLWALLPLVARRTLDLGSGGYGLLLGCVGIGALVGATFSPAIRARLARAG